jgi:hypothetical protein
MIGLAPEELSKNITRCAERLERDIDRRVSRAPILLEIRDLRRCLTTLEGELIEGYSTHRGDAC